MEVEQCLHSDLKRNMNKPHRVITTVRRPEKHCFHLDGNFTAIWDTENWCTPRATHHSTKREHLSKENRREILKLNKVRPCL